ncbi:MAG: Hsp70 family protein [Calditrichaeota bacterium]|nr:MAG: Hsp70 family protein [Calditrichota bacterium]
MVRETMKISKAVGIDLGTTRSLIGILDAEDKKIELWRNENGKATVPSVVQWDKKEKRFKVGDEALLSRYKEPYPVRSIKRQMGFNVDIDHAGKKYKPEQISAEILSFLKTCAGDLVKNALEKYSKGVEYIMDRAIVTIPAYFDQPKIEATRTAAELAGLQTLELLHEPTAAAIYFCWKNKIKDGHFLVYDLGGGTFDVSILRRISGSFEVLGIAGDNVLGGDTFDMSLAKHICDELDKGSYAMKLDVQNDPEDKARFDYFVHKAEGIKMTLTTEDQILYSDTACPFTDKSGNSIIVEQKITRKKFEELIASKVDRTVEICHEAIENAKKKAEGVFNGIEDIDYILLVGGSTWIPYIKKRIKEELCAAEGKTNCAKATDISQDEPDECVAMGAALAAASSGGLVFHDVGASLHLEGAAISSDDEYRMKGNVFLPGKENITESPFTGFTIDLSQDDEELETCEIDQTGYFQFEEVFLESGNASKLTLTLKDLSDTEVAIFSRFIEHGEGIGDPVNAVNSKPIWIYTLNSKGQREKTVIIDTGEALPTDKGRSDLSVTDPNQVLLQIHQGDKIIKAATQPFKEPQSVGTSIEFTISMDDKGSMIIRSEVGDLEPFVMQLDTPKDEIISKKDVDSVVKEFNKLIQDVEPGKRKIKEVLHKRILKDLEEALGHGDIALAEERIAELKQLNQDLVDVAPKLYPEKAEFDKLVTEIKGLLHSKADDIKNSDDLLKNVDAQVQNGNTAFKENDQQAWSESYNALCSYKNYIEEQIQSVTPPPNGGGEPDWMQIVPAAKQHFINQLQMLKNDTSDPAVRQEADRLIDALEMIPDVFLSPQEAMSHVPQIRATIKFIETVQDRFSGPGVKSSKPGYPGLPGLN